MRIENFSAARQIAVAAMAAGALLLGACATHTPPPLPEPSAEGVPAMGDDVASQESVPNGELDGRLLYQLLMTEIAAQRGLPDAAYATEFNVARETRDPRIARRATEFALMSRQPAAALQSGYLWMELSPNSDEARDTVLNVLAITGRIDEAEPLLRKLLANSPSKPRAFGQIQGVLSRSPNHAAAYALMQKLVAENPSIAEAHFALAQAALAAGDKTKAVEEARLSALLRPDWEVPPIYIAQLLEGDAPAQSEATLTEFIKRKPRSVDMQMAYARFLIGQKRYDDASVQFQKLLKLRPNDGDTLYTLALLSYQAGKPADAERYFKRFIAVRGNAPEAVQDDEGTEVTSDAPGSNRTVAGAYLYLSQIAEDRKDYPAALDYLANIDAGAEWLNAHIRRSLILSRQGKLDQARNELHDLQVHTDAERTQLILAEAQLLRDADRNEDALKVLTDALQKSPEDADLLYDQGMTAEKLNRLDLMEASLRTLIKLRPDYAQAYNALGYTFADRNIRLPEARELIDKALSLAPDDASIIDSLGWVQYRQGNVPQAIDALQRAYGLRGDAEIAVHLGEVLWVAGRKVEAEKAWKEAVRKEPSNDLLRQTLARFNVSVGSL